MKDWISRATVLFEAEKPKHFTYFTHCEECAEHDETLRGGSLDDIGLEALGNPGWDPLSFSSSEGIMYYMPALIRLSLETINDEFYFGHLLFHLESNGKDNDLAVHCSPEQKRFIADFIAYIIQAFPEQLDNACYSDEAFRAYDIWSKA